MFFNLEFNINILQFWSSHMFVFSSWYHHHKKNILHHSGLSANSISQNCIFYHVIMEYQKCHKLWHIGHFETNSNHIVRKVQLYRHTMVGLTPTLLVRLLWSLDIFAYYYSQIYFLGCLVNIHLPIVATEVVHGLVPWWCIKEKRDISSIDCKWKFHSPKVIFVS